MDKDTVRNKFFDAGVKTHTKDGIHKWLEIGPGAHGTLTKMVLRAHEECTIVAIEAVEESCKQVRKLLMQDRRRLIVLHGYAGEVALPTNSNFTALIAEILGHFGSR